MLLELAEKMLNTYFAMIPRKKPESKEIQAARLIAHRGAHDNKQGLIENTLEAFRLAQETGCWGIELDVRLTADQVLVVNHDQSLERLWGIKANIETLNFSELRTLAPKVPSLHEVIHEFGKKIHLFIELKTTLPVATPLITDLQDLVPTNDFHLLSLDPLNFKPLSSFPSESLLLVAGLQNVQIFCTLSRNKGYGGLLGSYLLLSDKYLQELDQAKQTYGVGFVNSKNSLFRELNRGIPWIFTNKAVKLSQYLQ